MFHYHSVIIYHAAWCFNNICWCLFWWWLMPFTPSITPLFYESFSLAFLCLALCFPHHICQFFFSHQMSQSHVISSADGHYRLATIESILPEILGCLLSILLSHCWHAIGLISHVPTLLTIWLIILIIYLLSLGFIFTISRLFPFHRLLHYFHWHHRGLPSHAPGMNVSVAQAWNEWGGPSRM